MAESVVLLHGMGRTRASLLILQRHLQQSGFEASSFPYMTSTTSLDGIARSLVDFIKDTVRNERYHLVGHSLGNIIIRHGFTLGYPDGLGRIVMIAPPNHPAKLAIKLKDNPIYKFLTGDCGAKLADEIFYETLPVPDREFGIISGTRGQSITFDEPNDGVVSVEGTKLSAMTDHIQLPNLHTFIMNSPASCEHCVRFLRSGRFVVTR